MSKLGDALDALWKVKTVQSDDYVKRDLELRCQVCDRHLCDVQDDDELGNLAEMALDHLDQAHGIGPGDVRKRGEVGL